MTVAGQKLHCLGPKRWDRWWRIVKIDRKAIGLVVVLHEAEHIVVDVAEEVDLGFNPPVVLHVCQSWMFVEQTRVPPTHLMVAQHVGVLYVVFLEYVCALGE